jgi:DNA replication protein DnaC
MKTKDDWQDLPCIPDPGCPACQGAGFVHPLKEDGSPDYGRAIPCPAPNCLLESIRAYKRGEPFARIQGVTEPGQTFDTFKPVPGTENALKYARALARGESEFIWLLIYGGVGNGKTHLCNAIATEALSRGVDVRMISIADLLSDLRSSMAEHGTDKLIRELKEIFLLILDDWGVEYGSDWERAKFDELMTSRFANARPTVLTSNKDVTELPARIKSRFEDRDLSRIAYDSAGDYRKGRKGIPEKSPKFWG